MASFLSSAWPVRKSMEDRLDGLPSGRLAEAPGELECPRGGGDRHRVNHIPVETAGYMYTIRR